MTLFGAIAIQLLTFFLTKLLDSVSVFTCFCHTRDSRQVSSLVGLMTCNAWLWFLLLALNQYVCRGEERESKSCFKKVEMPLYSGIVWAAQIQGMASVSVTVDVEGRPSKIAVKSSHEAMTNWLTYWFSKQEYMRDCKSNPLRLSFKYQLEGKPTEAPVNRLIVRHPDMFEVISTPPKLQMSVD